MMASKIQRIILPAPAKVNLALHVCGQRPDGFHTLESLVIFADIGDVLEVRALDAAKGAPAGADPFSITGPFSAGLTIGQDNLILKALELFRAQDALQPGQYFQIELEKNLPLTSGIGGGSADAAAMLNILNMLASISLTDAKLKELATHLGADVSVCLDNHPSLMRGIGDQIIPLSGVPACPIVLINPLKPVSTPSVFEKLQQRHNSALPENLGNWTTQADMIAWLQGTRNDLCVPAISLVPEIEQITMVLSAQNGCQFARMSGSGATVFGLFKTKALAMQAESDLMQRWPDYWIKSGSTHPSV